MELEGDVIYEPREEHLETIEEEGVEDILHPDEGCSLVLWRCMHSQTLPLEDIQRSAIFQTRCTIQGKVCDLIIDSGSCTNVASTTLVENLVYQH